MGASVVACSPLHRVAEWVAQLPLLAHDSSLPIMSIFPGDLHGFSGDQPTLAHKLLRDKFAFLAAKGGPPPPSQTTDVVIVGGGVAGLCAAYALRQRSCVVFEQDSRWGGNSKGEQWGDLTYSIGAAYISPPEEGTGIYNLLKDLGLLNHYRIERAWDDATVLNGEHVVPHFWQGATNPAQAADFVRIFQIFKSVYSDAYPVIPPGGGTFPQAQFNALDQMSFKSWMALHLGTIPSHVDEFIQDYCWSSFGGGYDEVSAAHGLFFLTADLQGTAAFPGGNAAILQKICEVLKREDRCQLKSESLVVDVRPVADGVDVTYADANEGLHTIRAQKCIIATPKYVARYLIDVVPESQRLAWEKLKYRAYVVANVLLRKKIPSRSYELFRLSGEMQPKGKVTDIVFAGWAATDHPSHSVLTMYKAYPFDGARTQLYQQDAYTQVQQELETALPTILSAAGTSDKHVVDLRITRWGHALPLAQVGLFATGVIDQIATPIANRIFFANQDNLSNPSFDAAFHAVEATLKVL